MLSSAWTNTASRSKQLCCGHLLLRQRVIAVISEVLACNKDETDVDNFTKVLLSAQQEFFVDPTALNSLKNLIQWTANLALHLAASAPEFKFRKGPLVGDSKITKRYLQLEDPSNFSTGFTTTLTSWQS